MATSKPLRGTSREIPTTSSPSAGSPKRMRAARRSSSSSGWKRSGSTQGGTTVIGRGIERVGIDHDQAHARSAIILAADANAVVQKRRRQLIRDAGQQAILRRRANQDQVLVGDIAVGHIRVGFALKAGGAERRCRRLC